MGSAADPGELYLGLLKECLTNRIYGDVELLPVNSTSGWKRLLVAAIESRGHRVLRPVPVSDEARLEGREWLPSAHTMIGMRRLDNLQHCIDSVLQDKVPGDLIEAGVWRGGASIFMRAVLKARGSEDRDVWLADSFQGLPPPNADRYPADAGDLHHAVPELAVTLEEVKANFARYDLLDERVRFLPGWFRDTLPQAQIERLALIRLDGDMYESTINALEALYPKLSPAGFLIVDDYGGVPGCRQAVDDFRSANGIVEELRSIDWTGVYWRRGADADAIG